MVGKVRRFIEVLGGSIGSGRFRVVRTIRGRVENKPGGRENVRNGPRRATRSHAFRVRLACRSVPLRSVRHCSKGAQAARVEECAAARAVRARCAGAESACAQARTRDAGVRRSRVSAWLGSRCVRPACRAHLVCPRASRQVRGRVAVVVGLAGAVDRPGARDLENAPGGLRRPALRRGRAWGVRRGDVHRYTVRTP